MDIGEIRNRVMQMESEDVRNELAWLYNAASQTLWDECQKAEDENARLAKALRHCKGLFEDILTEEDLQLVCGLCGNGLTHIDMILKPNTRIADTGGANAIKANAQISGGTPSAESDCWASPSEDK